MNVVLVVYFPFYYARCFRADLKGADTNFQKIWVAHPENVHLHYRSRVEVVLVGVYAVTFSVVAATPAICEAPAHQEAYPLCFWRAGNCSYVQAPPLSPSGENGSELHLLRRRNGQRLQLLYTVLYWLRAHVHASNSRPLRPHRANKSETQPAARARSRLWEVRSRAYGRHVHVSATKVQRRIRVRNFRRNHRPH